MADGLALEGLARAVASWSRETAALAQSLDDQEMLVELKVGIPGRGRPKTGRSGQAPK